uniref:DnaJ domain protein n=1 Tax=Mimivirus LCMiAC02 TaxID=2506609 RepID=A0A481Z101_9VIRU|nr:MAG: DnaJ domain protein [Mimivirus LCMiAC02]
MNNYYDILGVDKNSTLTDIKKAYKSLVLKWHPDKNKTKKKLAEQKFKEISTAYKVLSNIEKRKHYDNDIFNNNNKFNFANDIDLNNIDLNNIFKDFKHFNILHDYFNFLTSIPKKKKNPAVFYNLDCTLEDLYYGNIKPIKITRTNHYHNPPTSIVIYREIKLKKGWKNDTKIMFDTLGDIYPNRTPSDIIFVVKELPHNIYKRINNDLIVECKISLYEALHGFSRTLTMIGGQNKIIKMVALSSSKQQYIILNGGMPIRKNKKIVGYGNIVVQFNIMFNCIKHQKKELISDILKN